MTKTDNNLPTKWSNSPCIYRTGRSRQGRQRQAAAAAPDARSDGMSPRQMPHKIHHKPTRHVMHTHHVYNLHDEWTMLRQETYDYFSRPFFRS